MKWAVAPTGGYGPFHYGLIAKAVMSRVHPTKQEPQIKLNTTLRFDCCTILVHLKGNAHGTFFKRSRATPEGVKRYKTANLSGFRPT